MKEKGEKKKNGDRLALEDLLLVWFGSACPFEVSITVYHL